MDGHTSQDQGLDVGYSDLGDEGDYGGLSLRIFLLSVVLVGVAFSFMGGRVVFVFLDLLFGRLFFDLLSFFSPFPSRFFFCFCFVSFLLGSTTA